MLMASRIWVSSCVPIRRSVHQSIAVAISFLGLRSLDSVPALDHIGLEADRPGAAVKLQEQTASIAEYRSRLIATPERCSRRYDMLEGQRVGRE